MEKIFISCGETSGDRYAAEIVKEVHRHDQSVRFSANGGQYLEAGGVSVIANVVDRSTIGFLEPIKYFVPSIGISEIVYANSKINTTE